MYGSPGHAAYPVVAAGAVRPRRLGARLARTRRAVACDQKKTKKRGGKRLKKDPVKTSMRAWPNQHVTPAGPPLPSYTRNLARLRDDASS